MKTPHQESVLSCAARILEAFSQEEPALTVSEIARRTGLHVATASRLVGELVAHGFLARDDDRRVRIGVRLWELAVRASPALSLRDAAMPFTEGVHDVVGHHVQLGVLNGDEVLFLERFSAPNAVINYTRIAGRLPLYASSSGLVLLAHGAADLKERLLAGPLTACTPATPATPTRLRATLAEVRQRGYAYRPGYVHEEALGAVARCVVRTGRWWRRCRSSSPTTRAPRRSFPSCVRPPEACPVRSARHRAGGGPVHDGGVTSVRTSPLTQ
ncbi:IclR family transcriptional regulator [Streptomyces sp. NPDC051051]|uniref:IclR family transcriptional regulator n=1 Tax=Streptomyces sp. NPDC051051 TaxID=3155666 RepID=UPI0034406A0F